MCVCITEILMFVSSITSLFLIDSRYLMFVLFNQRLVLKATWSLYDVFSKRRIVSGKNLRVKDTDEE